MAKPGRGILETFTITSNTGKTFLVASDTWLHKPADPTGNNIRRANTSRTKRNQSKNKSGRRRYNPRCKL